MLLNTSSYFVIMFQATLSGSVVLTCVVVVRFVLVVFSLFSFGLIADFKAKGQSLLPNK